MAAIFDQEVRVYLCPPHNAGYVQLQLKYDRRSETNFISQSVLQKFDWGDFRGHSILDKKAGATIKLSLVQLPLYGRKVNLNFKISTTPDPEIVLGTEGYIAVLTLWNDGSIDDNRHRGHCEWQLVCLQVVCLMLIVIEDSINSTLPDPGPCESCGKEATSGKRNTFLTLLGFV